MTRLVHAKVSGHYATLNYLKYCVQFDQLIFNDIENLFSSFAQIHTTNW